jgi:hypothetical protein
VLLGEEGREGRWKSERKWKSERRWKSGTGRTLEANKYIDVQ